MRLRILALQCAPAPRLAWLRFLLKLGILLRRIPKLCFSGSRGLGARQLTSEPLMAGARRLPRHHKGRPGRVRNRDPTTGKPNDTAQINRAGAGALVNACSRRCTRLGSTGYQSDGFSAVHTNHAAPRRHDDRPSGESRPMGSSPLLPTAPLCARLPN